MWDDAIGVLKVADEFVGVAATAGISMITNGWEAFTDNTLDAEEKWQHFTVGTGVDVGLGVVVGIVVATIVGGAAAFAVLIGAITSAPVTGILLVTAVVAAGIGILLDWTGVTDWVKDLANDLVDDWQGEE